LMTLFKLLFQVNNLVTFPVVLIVSYTLSGTFMGGETVRPVFDSYNRSKRVWILISFNLGQPQVEGDQSIGNKEEMVRQRRVREGRAEQGGTSLATEEFF